MPEKVLFAKSVDIVPVRRGLYKDVMKDIKGFKVIASCSTAADEAVSKTQNVRRQRHWGDDPEFDTVMSNFGNTPGKPGEVIEQHLVFGFANVTVQENGTTPFDWQGDVIETEVLETAAYNFVLNHGLANQEHGYDTECGWLVESMMFTKEKMAVLGIPEGTVPEGWFVGFYIPDTTVYEKVKNGEYNMFSIEGNAVRVPLGDGIRVDYE